MIIRTAADVTPLEEDMRAIGLEMPNGGNTSILSPAFRKRLELHEDKQQEDEPKKGKSRKGLVSKYKAHRQAPKRQIRNYGIPLVQGTDRVSNLIEEVQTLVESIESSSQADVVKAFANAAIVADILSSRFTAMAESLVNSPDIDDPDIEDVARGLVGLAEQFSALAEDAADSAEGLRDALAEGLFESEIDEEALEAHYRDLMSGLLDGLDVYSDLTEADTDDDDEESKPPRRGHKEPDGDEDEDGDEDDDEEDEEEEERSSKKKSKR